MELPINIDYIMLIPPIVYEHTCIESRFLVETRPNFFQASSLVYQLVWSHTIVDQLYYNWIAEIFLDGNCSRVFY